MRNTEEWMERIFADSADECYRFSPLATEDTKTAHFMLVPSKGDKVEIPVFIIKQYGDMLDQKTLDGVPDYISIPLKVSGYKNFYTSFDRIIRSTLHDSFSSHGLVKLQGKDGSDIHTYYATKSALFDKNLNPLMMCTWQMEKRMAIPGQVTYREAVYKSYFIKPILRIAPEFYLAKHDNVGRFINKKMISLILSKATYTPRYYLSDHLGVLYNHPYIPAVLIEDIPFEIKTVPAPSVSTTREELLNLALENLEDME